MKTVWTLFARRGVYSYPGVFFLIGFTIDDVSWLPDYGGGWKTGEDEPAMRPIAESSEV